MRQCFEHQLQAKRRSYALPFKGRARVGMGNARPIVPIPLPTSPLKGEERVAGIARHDGIVRYAQ
jgi:hypothetical protein